MQALPQIIIKNGKLTMPGFDPKKSGKPILIGDAIEAAAGLTLSHILRSPTTSRDEFITRFVPETETIADGERVDYNRKRWQPVEIRKVLLFFNYMYFEKIQEDYSGSEMLGKPLRSETGGEFTQIKDVSYVEKVVWGYLLRLKAALDKLGIPAPIMNLPSDLPYGRVQNLAEIRKRLNSEPVLTPTMQEFMRDYGFSGFKQVAIQAQEVQGIFELLRKEKKLGSEFPIDDKRTLDRLLNNINGNLMLFGPETAFRNQAQIWLDTLIKTGNLEALVDKVYPGGLEAWKAKNERKGYDYRFLQKNDGSYSIELRDSKPRFVRKRNGNYEKPELRDVKKSAPSLEILIGNKRNGNMPNPWCPLIMCSVLRRAEQLGFSHFIGGFHTAEAEVMSPSVLLAKHVFGIDLRNYIMEFDASTGTPLSSSNGQLAFKYHKGTSVEERNIRHMLKVLQDERYKSYKSFIP